MKMSYLSVFEYPLFNDVKSHFKRICVNSKFNNSNLGSVYKRDWLLSGRIKCCTSVTMLLDADC